MSCSVLCLYGSPRRYSGKRNRLESVPYPYLSTPGPPPPPPPPGPDTHTWESGLLCVHPSFWKNSWRPCQPCAHGRFLQEPAGVSRNTVCSGHFSCQDQDGTRRHLLVPRAETKPLLSLQRCFTCFLPFGTALHFGPHIPKRSPFPEFSTLSHQRLSQHYKPSLSPAGMELFYFKFEVL